jgi:hypothetical protein
MEKNKIKKTEENDNFNKDELLKYYNEFMIKYKSHLINIRN